MVFIWSTVPSIATGAAYEQGAHDCRKWRVGRGSVPFWALKAKPLEGHFIDLLLYMLGDPEPVSIQGIISKLNPAEGDTSGMKFVQDTAILSALIRFDNGTTAHVAGTGVGREIELVCTNGVIRVVNDGEAVQMRRRDTVSDAWDPGFQLNRYRRGVVPCILSVTSSKQSKPETPRQEQSPGDDA